METTRHVIVVHHAPFIVEVVDMVLSMKGYTVHPASSYVRAKALLNVLGADVAAVIAHGDMPNEPAPGTLLRMVELSHPGAGLVVLSARLAGDNGPVPDKAVALQQPFDRAQLLAAIEAACDPRQRPASGPSASL
jgi:DNA-binding NtrC family response regulator